MLLDRIVFCFGVFLVCAVAVFNHLYGAQAQATTWSAATESPVSPVLSHAVPALPASALAGAALR
jgi:hypothetical protein